ncbi:hypothetical protein K474DRAFT_1577323, partial [Panus rudis PR-1116 ss-1]
WTSFDLSVRSEPPELFSVYTLSSISNSSDQIRFFCSAEWSTAPARPEEEKHVIGLWRSFYQQRNLHGDSMPRIFHELEGFKRVVCIGSLHVKWIACLTPFIVNDGPCYKYIHPPNLTATRTVESARWDASPNPKWIITELREDDIDLVNSRVHFPRPRESLRIRLPWSVAIRHADKPDGPPIAWQVLYSDGSMGMLHVEPESRRQGLAKLCISALMRKVEEGFHIDDPKFAEKYPWKRWEHMDVVVGNEKSTALISSLDGWVGGWGCHWSRL